MHRSLPKKAPGEQDRRGKPRRPLQRARDRPPPHHVIPGFSSGGDGGGFRGAGGFAAFGGRPLRAVANGRLAYAGALAVPRAVFGPGQLPPCAPAKRSTPYHGPNPRAPDFAKKQAGNDVLQVFWTPVFARGKIAIYVCDPDAGGVEAPAKLNKSGPLACFVRMELPGILKGMQEEHGWPTLPRVVVHDKASYMVNSTTQQLNPVFGGALAEAGLRSWTGPEGASTKWLAARLGDVYPHETARSPISDVCWRRSLCATSLARRFHSSSAA